MIKIALVVLSLFIFFCSAQQPQQILNLPGAPKLNFTQYGGYITLAGGYNYYYWFVESQRNPSKDPLILWLNGGPGCSSLGGLLSENGPFSPNEKGVLELNPFSWNKIANVLYLESPAGVGFSYCSTGCPTYSDNLTALQNYEFLIKWFSQYPSFSTNDFYIIGESYAGHYIPQTVYQIYLNTPNNKNVPPHSNFKGFAAGNPLTDEYYDITGPYLTTYFQTHGVISLDDKNENDAQGNFDPYDILTDVCTSSRLSKYIRFPHPINNMKGLQPGETTRKRYVPNPPACIDNYVSDYANTLAVQNAIHASPRTWTDCAGPNYRFGTESIIPYYQIFLSSTNYKILVYSGDADTVLNFIATERWVLDLKRPVVKKWAPWYYDGGFGKQVGGWGAVFDRLTYKTIKGAGHMVPWFQPAPALQLLTDFLNE